MTRVERAKAIYLKELKASQERQKQRRTVMQERGEGRAQDIGISESDSEHEDETNELECHDSEFETEGDGSSEPSLVGGPTAQSTARAISEDESGLPPWRLSTRTDRRLDGTYAISHAAGTLNQSSNMQDKSRKTIVHDFVLPQGETVCPLGDITRLMKKENWPLDEFEEKKDMTRRASWVIWAKKFQTVCSLMGNLEATQAKQMLLLKGGSTIWTILGGAIHELGMQDLWKRIDEHYATLGDPDSELVKYHEIRQKEGEDFGDFINRLKTQASQAELTEQKEQEEFQTAILERSLVGDKLAHERKMRNLSSNDLVLLGTSLCKQREKKHMLKRVQLINEQKTISLQRDETKVIHVVDRFKRKNSGDDNRAPKRFRPAEQKTACRSCGRDHSGRCTAPPDAKLCFKCGKPGHYAVSCGAKNASDKPQKKIFQVNSKANDDDWDD